MISQALRLNTYSVVLPSRTEVAEGLFKAASVLTTPACKTRELYYRMKLVDTLDPSALRVVSWAKTFWLFIQMAVCALVASITTVFGIALRALAVRLSEQPFIYKRGEAVEGRYQANTFQMLSWNICCVPGGYTFTDGGLSQWPARMNNIIQTINQNNADVVCLYEVMDYHAALRLFDGLKQNYAHFYFNIGAQAFGPNSGLFVASKVAVDNPHFVRFPVEMLVGRTRHAAKGVFSFDVPNARIFTTHLQHSEIPGQPTNEEQGARQHEIELITQHMNQVQNRGALLTGDLNLDPQEYQQSPLQQHFEFPQHFENAPTWGGDALCAGWMDKPASGPRTLDYTVARQGTVTSIATQQVATGYDQNQYRAQALSDHNGLLSTVQLR